MTEEPKFVVDNNVGRLARWLRVMGYDSLFFREQDDGKMVELALAEGRIILTKDTQIMRRRLVNEGKLRVILIEDDTLKAQLQQVVKTFNLNCESNSFSRCLECNQLLLPRSREEVKNLVPPYVFQTQTQYMQCPECHRIYWRGTHWQAMSNRLGNLTDGDKKN